MTKLSKQPYSQMTQMMADVDAYKPSWTNTSKYSIYARYFFEYIRHRDFRSLGASLKYVFTHQLPQTGYETSSGMGKFLIRKNTTDFQFINYAYEKSVKDYLRQNLNTFDVFIDVGACIGEYCIWLAKEGKQCVAVEPVNYKGLTDNIAINALTDKIDVFACGVGEKKERVFFNILDGVTSSSHVARDSKQEPNVDIELLDTIMASVKMPPNARVIMKLDVEGMEPEVIKGASQFITSCKNLRVIYEHFIEDEYRNDKSLLELGNFSFDNLDSSNRIATKL